MQLPSAGVLPIPVPPLPALRPPPSVQQCTAPQQGVLSADTKGLRCSPDSADPAACRCLRCRRTTRCQSPHPCRSRTGPPLAQQTTSCRPVRVSRRLGLRPRTLPRPPSCLRPPRSPARPWVSNLFSRRACMQDDALAPRDISPWVHQPHPARCHCAAQHMWLDMATVNPCNGPPGQVGCLTSCSMCPACRQANCEGVQLVATHRRTRTTSCVLGGWLDMH